MSSFRCLGVMSLVSPGVIGATHVIIQVSWCHQSGVTGCHLVTMYFIYGLPHFSAGVWANQ